MADYIKLASDNIRETVSSTVISLQQNGDLPMGDLPDFAVEIPGDTSHGDFACNIAMVGAKLFRKSPQITAKMIAEAINPNDSLISSCDVAGPGFLNFFVDKSWFSSVISGILNEGSDYGKSDDHAGEKMMVEFVSANPTGPMHMGNARGGGLGDTLAECMAWCGYDVTREFYVNDAGNQILKFGDSLSARYLQIYLGEENVPFPENGYQGVDIVERAKEFAAIHGDKYVKMPREELARDMVDYAMPLNVSKLKSDLEKYDIHYDIWFKESILHTDGTIDKIINILRDKGLVYDQDDATWYRATEFGSEKDEVLIRQNGTPTYFAADIAYHYNKFAIRGFDKVVNVWGSDHHGHVARIKGAMDAIGLKGDDLHIVLMQLVRLIKDGSPVRMSKRTGKVITLSDLLDEVPLDAARFYFNMREPNSQMDFDLGLAVEQTSSNPVYYVQYAHARICSIFKNIEVEGDIKLSDLTADDLLLLEKPEEISLIRNLAEFTGIIKDSVKKYDPSQLTHYVMELAGEFHKFYNACRVKSDDVPLSRARLAICKATGITIKNSLEILKVSAPESM